MSSIYIDCIEASLFKPLDPPSESDIAWWDSDLTKGLGVAFADKVRIFVSNMAVKVGLTSLPAVAVVPFRAAACIRLSAAGGRAKDLKKESAKCG